MTVLLQDRNCIIYGAGGAIGGAVARRFAQEGATVHLAGRTREPLDAVAAEIAADGGRAEVAVLDALDEQAVDEHARAVAARAGSVDVSFNLIARGDVQGIALVDMTADDFARPVTTGLMSTFNTARAAARLMAEQGSGVILSLTSGSARGSHPMMGGTGPADAATEAFLRYLAAEIGPRGVRVAGIYTAGVAGTLTQEKLAGVSADAPDLEIVDRMLTSLTMLKRRPQLDDIVGTAAFLASDHAAGITATIVNVTCGIVPGP
jgi:NAD(P)-dependent dehydrogenase (short-subunit alcohol dehydrogenase family)